MKRKKLLFTIACVSLLTCCNNNKDLQVDQTYIDSCNVSIARGYEKKEYWVNDPISIVLELSKVGRVSKMAEIKYEKLNNGESPRSVKISISETGILDDDNQELNTTYLLDYEEGRWKLK